MWWEWVIVILAVGGALAWAVRRVYRQIRGRAGAACRGCPEAGDTGRSQPVRMRLDAESERR